MTDNDGDSISMFVGRRYGSPAANDVTIQLFIQRIQLLTISNGNLQRLTAAKPANQPA